jgi:GcrA cell cycle regulator
VAAKQDGERQPPGSNAALTRDTALALWARGKTASEVADALAELGEAAGVGADDAIGPAQVKAMVIAARKRGDARAVRHPRGPKRQWSAARIDLLRRLWAGGKTCSEIARALTAAGAGDIGRGGDIAVTRNAVIGKAFRLRLARRGSPLFGWRRDAARPGHAVAAVVPALHRQRALPGNGRAARPGEREAPIQIGYAPEAAPPARFAAGPGHSVAQAPVADAAPPMHDPAILAIAVTLLDRTPRQCPFPLGEPAGAATLMCGAAKIGSDPYCARHLRLAYAAPPATWSAERRARFYAPATGPDGEGTAEQRQAAQSSRPGRAA